ncbi:MAG: tetratricopeptide repeat protein, partial [Pseudoclavibacter sp.]|nr:tetratricopeptide repeat protein [Pseudoclavibacter sp.]
MSDLAAALAGAEKLSAIGRHEQALQLLMEHARSGRQDPGWLTALAWAQYRLGRLQEAARTADEALRLAPQSTTLLYLRGLIELVHGHASAALDYANQAIAADPQSPLGHELLARERIVRLRRLRKRRRVPPERVEEAIEAAERTGADPSLIAILRAQMWSARGRRDKAYEHIGAALARAPMHRELRRMKVAYSAPEAEGELEAIELLWGLLAEAPMDVEAQDELAIRYLRRLQPQALSVLAIFTAASVLLMLPPSPAATCALVGAVLLPWRFLRRRRRTLRLLARRGHDAELRAARGLRAGGALTLTASLTALLPLAATPFLSEAGSAPALAWIAAASGAAGACLAWLAERLNRRGIL